MVFLLQRGRLAGLARPAILAALLIAAVAAVLIAAAIAWHPRAERAPAVTFTSLVGERIELAALRGRVAVVNFWATDCAVCVKEMPDLARTHSRFHARGLEVIAVAMRHDPPNYVIHFTERNQLPFKVALDPMGEHATAFGYVKLTPTTFVIDRRGAVALRHVGPIDFGRLNALIEEKLGERV